MDAEAGGKSPDFSSLKLEEEDSLSPSLLPFSFDPIKEWLLDPSLIPCPSSMRTGCTDPSSAVVGDFGHDKQRIASEDEADRGGYGNLSGPPSAAMPTGSVAIDGEQGKGAVTCIDTVAVAGGKDSEDESDSEDGETDSESGTSESETESSSSSDDDEEDDDDKVDEKESHGRTKRRGVDEVEEGEINSLDQEEASFLSSGDEEDAAPKGPIRSKNELSFLPPVPPVDAVLSHHHQTLPVGVISSIIGCKVIVDGLVKHSPLNEGSILWITESKSPLGLIDEIFGPVKNPYYVVRYNSDKEVPVGIREGTEVSYVAEFSDCILNENDLHQKGYDASGDCDEEVSDEIEFSDDEKEEEYKRRMQRQTKRGNNQRHVNQGSVNKKNQVKNGGFRKFPQHRASQEQEGTARPALGVSITLQSPRAGGNHDGDNHTYSSGPAHDFGNRPPAPTIPHSVQSNAFVGDQQPNFLMQQPTAAWAAGLPIQQHNMAFLNGLMTNTPPFYNLQQLQQTPQHHQFQQQQLQQTPQHHQFQQLQQLQQNTQQTPQHHQYQQQQQLQQNPQQNQFQQQQQLPQNSQHHYLQQQQPQQQQLVSVIPNGFPCQQQFTPHQAASFNFAMQNGMLNPPTHAMCIEPMGSAVFGHPPNMYDNVSTIRAPCINNNHQVFEQHPPSAVQGIMNSPMQFNMGSYSVHGRGAHPQNARSPFGRRGQP